MEKDTTANRLKLLMNELQLRQVDILNRTKPYCEKFGVKLTKSDISHYVSGRVEPSQDKLVVLGMALNVQESWLMGFDVPRERSPNVQRAEKDFGLIQKFSLLNERDQRIVLDLINLMIKT